MVLHKFTNAHYNPPQPQNYATAGMPISTTLGYHMIDNGSQFVYIDLEKVVAISTNGGYTSLHIMNMGCIQVAEHISEVIALLEGRDAMPSKILFGKKEA